MKCNKRNCISGDIGGKQSDRMAAAIVVWLVACFVSSAARADPPLSRSVLVLDQSAPLKPWSSTIIAAVQSSKSDKPGNPISYYVEHLDLFGFGKRQYDDILRTYLSDKYRGKPIDVILSIGPSALDFAVRLRATEWPAVPIVFTAVSEATAPHPIPPNTTGFFVQKTFANMVKAARTIIPNLKRLVLVGNPFEGAIYYPQFAKEIPELSREFEIIDLMGLPVREIRQRVAALPSDSAVFYFSINADPERTYVTGVEALPLIAEVTNRPIISDGETRVGEGSIGGFVLSPAEIGRDAGRLVMRILDGENASNIPVITGTTLKPMFDWRQLQRWNISESMLPAGSEIRFRPLGMWEQYSVQILAACVALLFQTALICWLVYEHRRRHVAEVKSRGAIAELTHMNRRAAAGQLSASLSHEVSQPLASIVTRASAALRWLRAENPNVERAEASLEGILAAGHRAGDIVASVRAMFKKDAPQKASTDINEIIRTVLSIVRVELQKNNIDLQTQLDEQLPPVQGDKVQLQQVVLNLVMNGIEAMHSVRPCVLKVQTDRAKPGLVHVLVEDTGAGIDPSKLHQIFEPLFTTKATGMGMGLAICQSIIESHGGRICVSPAVTRGSIFEFELPINTASELDGVIAA
jgi:signal transduction histidine kinase